MSGMHSLSAHNGGLCAALAALKAQTQLAANKPVDRMQLELLQNRIEQMPSEVNAIINLALRSGRAVPDMTEQFVLKQIMPGEAYD